MSGRVHVGPITYKATNTMARYLRQKLSGGEVVIAGATEADIGTNDERVVTAGDLVAVIPPNMDGTVRMVAGESITQYDNVYGYTGGKIGDTVNSNLIGIALEDASGDGSEIEVLRNVVTNELATRDALEGNLFFDDDFIGDWPAQDVVLPLGSSQPWLKIETDGLGIIDVASPNGIKMFSFDVQAEVAVAALYMPNFPFDIDSKPIMEFLMAVYDEGDDANLDMNWGLAGDYNADGDTIAVSAFFHLDGNSLLLYLESDDGSSEQAAITTGVTLTAEQWYRFKIDASDNEDVKFYLDDVRLLPGTTFDIGAASGGVSPMIHMEKGSNDTTVDVRVDRIRVQSQRA